MNDVGAVNWTADQGVAIGPATRRTHERLHLLHGRRQGEGSGASELRHEDAGGGARLFGSESTGAQIQGVAQAFATDEDLATRARLDTLVTVVDASAFSENFAVNTMM